MQLFPGILLMLILLAQTGPGNAAVTDVDYRILIDESGSMELTDPDNSRIPALKLLNALIPQGANAGIWTVGRYADMTVKWGRVDQAWREAADRSVDLIQSNGAFSNIESALKRATSNWKTEKSNVRRVVILLTDGGIRISSKPAKNEKSRQRVLGPVLESLKAKGVSVHSIALSPNADRKLLLSLAHETQGSYSFTYDSLELRRVLMNIFQRINQPNLVPFNDQGFAIDETISAMTLVMFGDFSGQPATLVLPDGSVLSAANPGDASWRSSAGFELVKLANPLAGKWRISVPISVENRLMVDSRLMLKVAGLPATSVAFRSMEISAELFRQGRKIKKNSFLRFVDFSFTHITPDGDEQRVALQHTAERQQKGRYLYALPEGLAPGVHRFKISAVGQNFSRSDYLEVAVSPP
ncbi:MAG: hypothetical protein ACI8XW_001680 [Gammaproteobacteria bacterium]|jgi:hypothetical protein